MKIVIKQYGNMLCADPVDLPGSPMMGVGHTMYEVMGNFVVAYQKELGLEIIVDPSAQYAEDARREAELSKR